MNESLGAVIPTQTPFAWPASNYSRTSSARPWIDATTTERLNNRHLCPDVLSKGQSLSPDIVRRIGEAASRDAGHRKQAYQGHTHSHEERSDHDTFNTVARELRRSKQLTVYSRSLPEVASSLLLLLFLQVLDAVLIRIAPVS